MRVAVVRGSSVLENNRFKVAINRGKVTSITLPTGAANPALRDTVYAGISVFDDGLQRQMTQWFRKIVIKGFGPDRVREATHLTPVGSYHVLEFGPHFKVAFRQDTGEFAFACDYESRVVATHPDNFQRIGPATRSMFDGMRRISAPNFTMKFWCEDTFRIGIDHYIGNTNERRQCGARRYATVTDPHADMTQRN